MSRLPLPSTVAYELSGHTGSIATIKYNASCEYIITASHETVRLFNASNGELIKSYKEHGKPVLAVALPLMTQDSARFATASADRNVFLWDTATGRVIIAS
jgi:WD40 repeat protein